MYIMSLFCSKVVNSNNNNNNNNIGWNNLACWVMILFLYKQHWMHLWRHAFLRIPAEFQEASQGILIPVIMAC